MILSDKGSGPKELPNAGPARAVCCRVFDLGEQEFMGQTKRQCLVMWELEQTYTEGEWAGKRMLVSRFYSASLFKSDDGRMSNLRRDLEAWAGRAMTPDEAAHFDTDKLIGKNCLLSIKHDKKNGKDVAVITAIMPPMGDARLTVETPMDYVPGWIQKMLDKGDAELDSAADAGFKGAKP